MPADPVIEAIVENSVLLFKQKLGWKTSFIDPEDVEVYKNELRRAIREVLTRKGVSC